ncbi:MAG TPA: iron-sulfur cluster assembly protein, partial [Anaerolineaceae bacterium]|nr:iron-sulfur cluster assembly protein [Anaerolineaceae bacterium]
MVNREQVINALSTVMDPELNRSLVELDMVRDLELQANGTVKFTLALTIPGCSLKDRMARDARTALLALEGVKQVDITFGAMTKEE